MWNGNQGKTPPETGDLKVTTSPGKEGEKPLKTAPPGREV